MTGTRNGLTLTELVLAMAILSIIAAAAAGVAAALGDANQAAEEMGESVQTARTALSQMVRDIQGASLITACDSTRISLWNGDLNGDNQINPEELTVISYDSANQRIVRQTVNHSVTANAYSLSQVSSASSVQNLMNGRAGNTVSPIAENVTAFGLIVSPAAPQSKLVTIKVTAGVGQSAVTESTTADLRADATSKLVFSRGAWSLVLGG